MNLIVDTLIALLPPKRKSTPSGWISFDAVCCHNRGEGRDTKKRGGVLTDHNGGFQYHCFNCGFKAGWTKGKLISSHTKLLFTWLGLVQTDLDKLGFEALRLRDDIPVLEKKFSFELENKTLPEHSLRLSEWADHLGNNIDENTSQDFLKILKYIMSRGYSDPFKLDLYWSPTPGFTDRVIIPFYHRRQLVGYTARKVSEGKPKYITDSQPGYVFNLDNQTEDRQFIIVTEGPFDALSIDGVAILTNEPNDAQCQRINQLQKNVIVVPDLDRAGSKLIKAALENKWAVSRPPWEADIKDVSDAMARYGKLYTLLTILHYRETNEIKIQILKKQLERLND